MRTDRTLRRGDWVWLAGPSRFHRRHRARPTSHARSHVRRPPSHAPPAGSVPAALWGLAALSEPAKEDPVRRSSTGPLSRSSGWADEVRLPSLAVGSSVVASFLPGRSRRWRGCAALEPHQAGPARPLAWRVEEVVTGSEQPRRSDERTGPGKRGAGESLVLAGATEGSGGCGDTTGGTSIHHRVGVRRGRGRRAAAVPREPFQVSGRWGEPGAIDTPSWRHGGAPEGDVAPG
jgi:hypothetical protein